MRNKHAAWRVLLCSFIMGGSFTFSAFAGVISTISLDIAADIQIGQSMDETPAEVISKNSKYEITGWEFKNEGFVWTDQMTPVLTVHLAAADDYKFRLHGPSDIKLKGAGAVYKSAERNTDSTEFAVTVNLQPLGHQVGNVENPVIGFNGLAVWEAAERAGSYEIILERSSASPIRLSSDKPWLDMRENLARSGNYSMRVRSINRDDGEVKGDWAYSSSVYISEATAEAYRKQLAAGNTLPAPCYDYGWQKDDIGWWYKRIDGTYPKLQWQQIKDQWYYFDESGYMDTGWIFSDGAWYYCDSSGKMLSNTVTPDGRRVGESGARE